ncbi:MAG TPA: hypothetical protein VI636_23830 [Candidatus Angelobacter sp.]
MQCRGSGFLIVTFLVVSFLAWGQNTPPAAPQNGGDFSSVTRPDPAKVVPRETIIVKGAWYSASDSTTPVPEGGSVTSQALTNQYFGMNLPLPSDWIQKHTPPPPSDSGRYVLAQLTPGPTYKKEKSRGVIMFAAQDLFFTPLPAANARQLVNYSRNHLPDDYKVEMKPTETRIGGQPFLFYAYWSPAAEIHWYVLSTQIRCHAVQIVMSSQDTKLLESLVLDLNKITLPAEASPTGGTGGGAVPVCIKDYARPENVIERVEPIFTVRRFNPVPVRIIIDKAGNVKYVHFLSAFPEQEKAINEALKKWKFRPYERDGQRMEVETGVMFGSAPPSVVPTAADAATD